ncbi:MAG: LysM peptidoglycan-binding domain-containing protein [Chloroflexi bacterium]|nr:LysM peptidoglycan-binding domain-containing protein [Chloroflexota bacterium]
MQTIARRALIVVALALLFAGVLSGCYRPAGDDVDPTQVGQVNADVISQDNVPPDGDGDADTDMTTDVDTDGDGVPDLNIDTDGDGVPDVNVDTDADGMPDVNIDTDGDGIADANLVEGDPMAPDRVQSPGEGSGTPTPPTPEQLTPTQTPQPSETPTPVTPTLTPTETLSPTPSLSPTSTFLPVPGFEEGAESTTPTGSASPDGASELVLPPTVTPTQGQIFIGSSPTPFIPPSPSPTPFVPVTPTFTLVPPTASFTPLTPTVTLTPTPVTPTQLPTLTPTPVTPTLTPSYTPVPPTRTLTYTPSPTTQFSRPPTFTPVTIQPPPDGETPARTPTLTMTPSISVTPTITPWFWPTFGPSPTYTPFPVEAIGPVAPVAPAEGVPMGERSAVTPPPPDSVASSAGQGGGSGSANLQGTPISSSQMTATSIVATATARYLATQGLLQPAPVQPGVATQPGAFESQPTQPGAAAPLVQGTPAPAGTVCGEHLISPGENLYRIALRYGVTIDQVAQMNGIVNADLIRAGDTLTIPCPLPATATTTESGTTAVTESGTVSGAYPAFGPFTYLVEPGDNLYRLALRYNVSMYELMTANGLTPATINMIYAGDELFIPAPSQTTTQPVATPAGQVG